MNEATNSRVHVPSQAAPTWEIAYLFPDQGHWSEEDYLALQGNRLLEFSHGWLEVLPMPTTSHQRLLLWLVGLLRAFDPESNLGTALIAPLRVRLWPGKFREPDVVFMLQKHAHRIGEDFWRGADLVMEIVSGSKEDRRRDLVTKRREYARAGISEYWIVDPEEERIIVLRLAGKRYMVHGKFPKGTVATSHLLRGFTVDVSEAFARATPARAREETRRKPKRSSRQ
jgi:Uma2 family endonuclease